MQGKERSKMNALKHGNRSAIAIAKQKEDNEEMRSLFKALDKAEKAIAKRKMLHSNIALLAALSQIDNFNLEEN